MIKDCRYKLYNKETKEVLIAVGDDVEWFIELGYTEIGDIEKGYDGKHYLAGYAPTQPLDVIKTAKLAELKNIRDTLETEPIEYNGNFFDYDDKARDRINSAIIALSITGQSIEWTTADNTNVLVTAGDLRGIVANVAVRSNELHVKYRLLKEQVEACTTKEELDKIQWEEQ